MATTKNIPALNPYVGDTKLEDPLISRVDFPNTGIGSRPSTMRGAWNNEGGHENVMGLTHVGGTTGGGARK